jgi:hypothetical protein
VICSFLRPFSASSPGFLGPVDSFSARVVKFHIAYGRMLSEHSAMSCSWWRRAAAAAAGALRIISQLHVEPAAAFSVPWSAEMIFATIIGGIGTIEGPIIGMIVFFVLQQTLSH